MTVLEPDPDHRPLDPAEEQLIGDLKKTEPPCNLILAGPTFRARLYFTFKS